MANVIHMPGPSAGGKKQRKKLVKQEAKLMLKVEQARKDVQKAQGKVTKAQGRLDDSQKRLQTIEGKLAALRSSSQKQQTDMNGSQQPQQATDQAANQDSVTGTTQEQGEQAQQSEQGEQSQQLPANETYVDGAVDTEQARTPDEASDDVMQGEEQELSQEHAVATDMAQAEDQGVVSVPPDTQEPDQNSNGQEDQVQSETQPPTELLDQHVPVSPHSDSYLQADDDDVTTDESEPTGFTQY